MRPHQSSGTVACLVATALLCSSVVLAGKIVFPEANDLPVMVEDAGAVEDGRKPEQSPPGTAVTAGAAEAAEAATLSPCVWAIVSCCQPGQSLVRTRCFELLGCGGHFWDASPCSDQLAWAAVRAAASFYQTPHDKSP